MTITPHWGTAEWVLAAKRTPVEVALARLGLPALRELDADPEDDHVGPRLLAGRLRASKPGKATKGLHKSPDGIGWSVYVSEVPAVSYTHLDVYKRQTQDGRGGEVGVHPSPPPAGVAGVGGAAAGA